MLMVSWKREDWIPSQIFEPHHRTGVDQGCAESSSFLSSYLVYSLHHVGQLPLASFGISLQARQLSLSVCSGMRKFRLICGVIIECKVRLMCHIYLLPRSYWVLLHSSNWRRNKPLSLKLLCQASTESRRCKTSVYICAKCVYISKWGQHVLGSNSDIACNYETLDPWLS